MSGRSIASHALSVLVSLFASSVFAQSLIPNNPGVKPAVAIRNATIHPVSSAPLENATLVFAGGVITAIGKDVTIPADADVIDGTGLHVYPGMIDSGATVGLIEMDSVPGTVDTTEIGDFNPHVRAVAALNPHSELVPVTRVNGVTHVLTEPQGGIISGQSALIRMAGWTPSEMVVKAPAGMQLQFPRLRSSPIVEPAEEESEKELQKGYSKQLENLRDVLRDAQSYATAVAAGAKASRFDRDLVLEALVPVVEGRVPVIVTANFERDIRAAIALADELKLKMILSGAQDAARVASELKSRDIPVLLGPILALPPREDDPYDLLFTNAKALHDAGVRFAIRSGETHNARNLPYHAAACAAFGLPKDVALKAVTLYPAQILGVADRLGSLEVGKSASLFITDGDPLEIVTNVRQVFIDGEEIPMRSRHTDLYEKFKNRP